MKISSDRKGTVALIAIYGSLWGIVESTLGYSLHLLRRLVVLPGLTGYILFPLGFLIMRAAVRRTGTPLSAIWVAAVAALVKLSSGLLPSVAWIFVANPVLSILAEGLLAAGGLAIFASLSEGRSALAFPQALAVSAGWRGLFLLLVLILPVQKGILMKGSTAILTFLLVDSAVNALLVGIPLWFAPGQRSGRKRWMVNWPVTRIGAAGALALAVGSEVVFATLS